MDSLLDLRTDSIETSAGRLTLLEDIEGTTGTVNEPLSGLCQRFLKVVAAHPWYIEQFPPEQTGDRVRTEHFKASFAYVILGIRRMSEILKSSQARLLFQLGTPAASSLLTICLTPDAPSNVTSHSAWKFPVIKPTLASWLESALKGVNHIAALPPNWDGYGSPPLGAKERSQVVRLLTSIEYEDLPTPTVVPVSGGGIQLEWQYGGRELELEIVAGSQDLLFLQVYEDGTTEEDSYPISDLARTRKLLDWLVTGD